MKELKKIMGIENISDREKALIHLANKMGVSISGLGSSSSAMIDENMLIERIEQRYIILLSRRSWILALIASIASVVSAVAAWIAIYIVKTL